MIDWHSHIPPEMDDGSRDLEESLAMLKALARQGVDTVIATPHFYANDEPPTRFLQRRAQAMEALCSRTDAPLPQIRMGAEVCYYAGISRRDDLKSLRIEGTDLLLLEMPEIRWTRSTVQELIDVSAIYGITLVLAHVDRYLSLQPSGVWAQLHESGVRMQMNADAFLSLRTRRKAFAMLQQGMVQMLGSDCHNMTSRPPKIGMAYEQIRKKFGPEFVAQMHDYGDDLLK